ncbi:hypothetical protein N8I77_000827 [Diaporthe amygdali]|uniref:Uncharacterized protein n=1 Tax=Phomopsis amygdali TaxID=1214568 RepID=A0AAD9SPM5_PHOAM|nr:hypothetical protein N8I77_000827 [Diaporthe amygdali]
MMGSSAFGPGVPPTGKTFTLLPPSLTQGAFDKASQTNLSRSIVNKHDQGPDAYVAQLMKRIIEKEKDIFLLMVRKSKQPFDEGRLEIMHKIRQRIRLYNTVWAIHMVEFADHPRVVELLEKNAHELTQQGADITSTLLKAQEAIAVGDTRPLEQHVNEVIERNNRRGLCALRPASELEKFMGQIPAGNAVLSRLRMLQGIATQNTEESRLLITDVMYGLWWILERKAKEFDRFARK